MLGIFPTFSMDQPAGGAVERDALTSELLGSAVLSSNRSKWGANSMYSFGYSDYASIKTPIPAFFDSEGNANTTAPGLQYGTVEFWFNFSSTTTASNSIFELYSDSYDSVISFDSYKDIGLRSFMWDVSESARVVRYSGKKRLSTSKWYHVAVCFRGYYADFYVDGDLIGTIGQDNDTWYTGGFPIESSDMWRVGRGDGDYYTNDFRISTIARYSGSSYTVPTAALENDEYTYCLFNWDDDILDNIG